MKNISKANIKRAQAEGKLAFKCSKHEKTRYTLADSYDHCQSKMKGWVMENVSFEEFAKHRQANRIKEFFKDAYGFGKELVGLIVNS